MSVTLADSSNFEASETCVVLLVFCSDTGHAVSCAGECHVFQHLNHDVVLGHN